jgi:hypothetical protein
MTLDFDGDIPAGRVYGPGTSADVDPAITFRIQAWMEDLPGSGEQSQIMRNDGILKTIMILAGLNPQNNLRNLRTDGTFGTTRPDFAALTRNVPLFLAEEKDDDNIADAVSDCTNKFR